MYKLADPAQAGAHHGTIVLLLAVIGGLIGAVSFSGSLIAFAKLQELMTGNAVLFRGQQLLNALLTVACLAIAAWVITVPVAGS